MTWKLSGTWVVVFLKTGAPYVENTVLCQGFNLIMSSLTHVSRSKFPIRLESCTCKCNSSCTRSDRVSLLLSIANATNAQEWNPLSTVGPCIWCDDISVHCWHKNQTDIGKVVRGMRFELEWKFKHSTHAKFAIVLKHWTPDYIWKLPCIHTG